jgi:translation initiation factor eIF-2B subunit beta
LRFRARCIGVATILSRTSTLCAGRHPPQIVDYDIVAEALPERGADAGEPADHPDTPFVHVPNPVYDYVPPELISLFVTDTGG